MKYLLLLISILLLAAPSLSHEGVSVTTSAQLKVAMDEGELRIRGGNANQGTITISSPVTWNLQYYPAGSVVKMDDIQLTLGANITMINVPDNFSINHFGTLSTTGANRIISSDRTTGDQLDWNVVTIAVPTTLSLSFDNMTVVYHRLKGAGASDAVGTIAATGGAPGILIAAAWASQYENRTGVAAWTSALDLGLQDLVSFSNVMYRCTAANCLGSEGDPTVNSEWVVVAPDTDTIFTPNTAPGVDHASYVAGHTNGANCAAGEIPIGVDASGVSEGCYEPTESDITDLAHTPPLNDLSDVTLTTPAVGATLVKSAGNWVDGQLDLADADAVTGLLPDANVAATIARDSEITTDISTHAAISAAHHTATVETNSLETTITGVLSTEVFVGSGADAGAFVALSGDATMTSGGVVTVVDDLHAHTTTSLSGIDISDDTNLAVTAPVVLTGDTVSVTLGTRQKYMPAYSLEVDGTQCANPASVTINSGPIVGAIVCADNASSAIYGSLPLPDNYSGTTVTFEMHAHEAAGTGVLSMDFSGQCRSNSDVINSTWGSAVEAAVTFATANDLMIDATAAVTPDGTCAAGDHLFWRAVMDSTTTTTATANILGVLVQYEIADFDEVD